MSIISALWEILERPTIGDVLSELMIFITPLWIAVLVGVLVGWTWKPKWANLGKSFFDSSSSKDSRASPIPSLDALKFQLPSCISWISDNGFHNDASSLQPSISNSDFRFC